jgi:hypothetical protein
VSRQALHFVLLMHTPGQFEHKYTQKRDTQTNNTHKNVRFDFILKM